MIKVKRYGFRKGMAALCAGALLASSMTVMAAGGSDNTPPPADAASGGVIYSNIYGEVLVTRQADGTYSYTFFDDDRPAVQELLSALNAGKKIDLDKLSDLEGDIFWQEHREYIKCQDFDYKDTTELGNFFSACCRKI